MAATQIGILVHERTMHGRDIAHLRRDICMTDRTTIRHSCSLPGRGMTSLTLTTELCMRCNTP